MKKKATAVLLILLMLVPALVGFVSYHVVKNSSISQKSVTRIDLTDLNGKQFGFERSAAELDIGNLSTNPVRFFMQLNSAAQETTGLPDPLMGAEYFKAVFTSYGRKVEYRYYFTTSAEYCYYQDNDERTFKISEEYSNAFLRSEYAMCLFEDAKLPTLTVSAGDVIEPTAISWKYKSVGEIKSEYKHEAEEADTSNHTISGSIELNFDIQPDALTLTVVRDGEAVYEGLYEDVGRLELPVGSQIQVTASAEWAETETRSYSGAATYAFNAVYLDKPIFYLGENNVEVGDFVVLTAKNVSDASTISFSSEPSINYTPIFFQDGVYYRALIPISIKGDHPESYLFTCSADGVSQDITMNVSPRRQKTSSTVEKMSDFKTSLSSVYTTQTAKRYFSGIFTDPFEKEKTAKVGFYNKRPDSAGNTVLHEGYDYPASSGETVCAVNNGVVLFAGDVENCGKLVVVDHGFGLMTTYVYLSNVTVKAGDEVKTGDKLGSAGASDVIHLELTVFGNPVDIDTLWKSGVITND
ncbi:MAG: M23 family metallopeptidase [Clostridia bacterium]|nr:M23 family metallopeptidase [Clostridia bacterium]